MTAGGRKVWLGICVAALYAASVALLAQPAAEVPVTILFADASARETAVRHALTAPLPAPTVLKAVRSVVQGYEAIVQRYPASPQADEALWRAAQLSTEALKVFGDPHERAAADRLQQWLIARYPSSRFAKPSPMLTAGLTTAPAAPAPQAPIDRVRAPKAATGPLATITAIRRASLADVVRVVIELDREVVFRDERIENPTRVFIDLAATDATKVLRDQTIRFDLDSDLVRQVRLGRHPNNTTRVVLEAADVSSYSVYPLYNPFRLVVDCLRERRGDPAIRPPESVPRLTTRRADLPLTTPLTLPLTVPLGADALDLGPAGSAEVADAQRGVPSSPSGPTPRVVAPLPVGEASKNLGGGLSTARQLGLGISRIVVDPGHGGHDPGAQSHGTTEAEFVLDVALRLERVIAKAPGIGLVLTRRSNEYVSLEERTAVANRENADLFLSIHANASSVGSVRGIETYFLNFATTPGAASVAARENAASGQTMGELPDVIKAIALTSKRDESKDFATHVQRALVARLRPLNRSIRDLGVKEAPFVVLIGAAMPSVLAEVAFLTNQQEARLTKSSTYRQRIAEALADAIGKYQESLKRVSTVARRP